MMRTCSKCGLRCYSVRNPPICKNCNLKVQCFHCGKLIVDSLYGTISFSVCEECKEQRKVG